MQATLFPLPPTEREYVFNEYVRPAFGEMPNVRLSLDVPAKWRDECPPVKVLDDGAKLYNYGVQWNNELGDGWYIVTFGKRGDGWICYSC